MDRSEGRTKASRYVWCEKSPWPLSLSMTRKPWELGAQEQVEKDRSSKGWSLLDTVITTCLDRSCQQEDHES